MENYSLSNPEVVIDFILANNFPAVQINMQSANLLQGGITPSVAKLELLKAFNKCADIRPILRVDFQQRGESVTGQIVANYNPNAPVSVSNFDWAALQAAMETALKPQCISLNQFMGWDSNTPIQNVQYTPQPKPEQSSPRPTGTTTPPPPAPAAPTAPAPVNSGLFSLDGFSGKQKIAAVLVLFVIVTLIAFRGS